MSADYPDADRQRLLEAIETPGSWDYAILQDDSHSAALLWDVLMVDYVESWESRTGRSVAEWIEERSTL